MRRKEKYIELTEKYTSLEMGRTVGRGFKETKDKEKENRENFHENGIIKYICQGSKEGHQYRKLIQTEKI